ncbi:MAG: phosphopentomutase [Lachnospiraceae bacterium]|nr:phosphopentomutase [Lachnospiraceae bacterium]
MNNKIKRVFLIVLDSVGIGELPDADAFGDRGSNTLKACYDSGKLCVPNMERLGLFAIQGNEYGRRIDVPEIEGSFGRLKESSLGKDTTIGHWEIAGLISPKPMPTYPNGFPEEIIEEFSRRTGRGVLCNQPYSGTEVIKKYGEEHKRTGDLIVYTSADSVFQVAAHEEIVPLQELYHYCEIARELLQGEHGVGRVIARPFIGENGNFTRTANRHDFSLIPPRDTLCDLMKKYGLDVIGIGKIYDIFAGKSITESTRTKNNTDGMEKTIELLSKDFTGLAFVNLVDFDMVYGHRNDVPGYTKALNTFDEQLGTFLKGMMEDDVLLITADHGCDPSTPSTDHSREYVPLLAWGQEIQPNVNLGTRSTFADISATILEMFHIKNTIDGDSFFKEIKRE